MKYKRCLAAAAAAAGILLASVVCWLCNDPPSSFVLGDVRLQNADGVSTGEQAAAALLKDYFSLRCSSYALAEGITTAPSGKAMPALSDAVRKNEAARIRQLRKLKKTWKCHYSGAFADVRIDRWRDTGEQLIYFVYEFQWFNNWYRGYTTAETADLSGCGVRHVLTLQRVSGGTVVSAATDGSFRLVSDDYDEGRPSFAASPGRLNNPDYVEYAGIPSVLPPTTSTKAPALPVNPAQFAASYSPAKAIAYADSWVFPYNTRLYPNLSGLGGDCCNFASQCLFAGGLPLTVQWTHLGRDTMGSPAWISSTRLYACLKGANGQTGVGQGVAVLRMDDAAGRFVRWGGKRYSAADLLQPGDPVFYRWSGGFAPDGYWNHTALCVGVMGDGTPAVSCHTADKYHIKWNYGGKGCDYGTVRLSGGYLLTEQNGM